LRFLIFELLLDRVPYLSTVRPFPMVGPGAFFRAHFFPAVIPFPPPIFSSLRQEPGFCHAAVTDSDITAVEPGQAPPAPPNDLVSLPFSPPPHPTGTCSFGCCRYCHTRFCGSPFSLTRFRFFPPSFHGESRSRKSLILSSFFYFWPVLPRFAWLISGPRKFFDC